jgi:asparagine synthase (glutamine-hydrolysing)
LTSKLKALLLDSVKHDLENSAYMEMQSRLPEAYVQWDGFSQAQYLEANGLLPGYILSSQGDRMSMAHSVEGRYPFLDHRVIEYTCKIPPKLKMKVLNEKYILKKTAGSLIPSSVKNRPKQPYRAPDARSFFDPQSQRARTSYVDELLSRDAILASGIFDSRAIEKLADRARKGQITGARESMALVGVVSTQLVIEQFINNLRRCN